LKNEITLLDQLKAAKKTAPASIRTTPTTPTTNSGPLRLAVPTRKTNANIPPKTLNRNSMVWMPRIPERLTEVGTF